MTFATLPGSRSNLSGAGKQRGVVLFIALIVLVAMTLAGIAIMRSVDTGNLIAGNVAFKQSTLQAGDYGLNAAITYLENNAFTGQLDTDQPPSGYSARGIEPTDWNDENVWANAVTVGTNSAGNTVQYLIYRLCLNTGAPQNNNCARSQKVGTDAGNSAGYGAFSGTAPPMVMYRVTARVVGPRDTTSIVQFNVALQQ